MAHSSGQNVGFNIGALCGVFKWPTQVVDIFGVILVNLVGYLNGQLQC